MTVIMYDTVTIDAVPSNPPAVAGYVGGFWPTYSPLVERFPNAKHLSIAVSATEDAECLDIENGDATPAQAPDWVKRQMARGVKIPVVYASLSVMPSVLAALQDAGLSRGAVRVWTAHYSFRPHLCGPQCGFGFNTTADATQWTDFALSRNLDQSECSAAFFGDVVPPVRNALHYDWFDQRPRVAACGRSEQFIVQLYDRFRATQAPTRHPHRAALASLRIILRFLANRVRSIADRQRLANNKPSWRIDHRGWRYQHLIHRAQGQRFV